MRPTVIIVEESGRYGLRTSRGHRLGARLHSVDPEKGFELPEIPAEDFANKNDAIRLKLAWNTYLLHAWRTRSYSKARVSE